MESRKGGCPQSACTRAPALAIKEKSTSHSLFFINLIL